MVDQDTLKNNIVDEMLINVMFRRQNNVNSTYG